MLVELVITPLGQEERADERVCMIALHAMRSASHTIIMVAPRVCVYVLAVEQHGTVVFECVDGIYPAVRARLITDGPLIPRSRLQVVCGVHWQHRQSAWPSGVSHAQQLHKMSELSVHCQPHP